MWIIGYKSTIMKPLTLLFLLFMFGRTYSQECLDTLYFNRDGKVVGSRLFAEYTRIALMPSDSAGYIRFRDYYATGELRREGTMLHIDTLDESRSVYDGWSIAYHKNGKVAEKVNYINGRRHGEYCRYDDRGNVKEFSTYVFGDLSGVRKRFNDDGSCRVDEYENGIPLNNYYILVDGHGNSLKFRTDNDMQIWESPLVSERSVEYRDGTPWEVYFKNGLTLALSDAVVRDYGKWHRLDIVITNNSYTPIEFVPEVDVRAYSADAEGSVTNLVVWSCDEYMKKVKRSQTWAAILVGFSEGLSASTAGYSTSTTTGYNNYGEYVTYTTTTYNAADAQIANLASQKRMADFGRSLQQEQDIRRMGYIKRNTIQPGESVSGFIHVGWVKGSRVVFIVTIEGAEYAYEWEFDRRTTQVVE